MVVALALTLVADGTLELDTPIGELLPELGALVVVRSMTGPADDIVPASRPITHRHLLTSTNGHGFPSEFAAPVVQVLAERLQQGPPIPPPYRRRTSGWRSSAGPAAPPAGGGLDLQHRVRHPRRAARAGARTSFVDLMAERILEPLGMVDTGFPVSADELHRFTSLYQRGEDGELTARTSPTASTPPHPLSRPVSGRPRHHR